MTGVQERSGALGSVVLHGAFVAFVFIIAGARPFSPSPAEAISVELVPATELPKPVEKPVEKFDMPKLPEWSDKREDAAANPAAASASAPAPALPPAQQKQTSASATAAPSAPPASANIPSLTTAGASDAATVKPAPPQPAPVQTAAAPVTAPAAPDISERYGVMLGLPSDKPADFDALAIDQAKIGSDFVTQFHKHLKTCSSLPASISSADNVKITLRVMFTADGRLAGPPSVVEASASSKGPLLMQASIKALTACQPYGMLPADKYNEWRVLDLKFTPADFSSS